MPDPRRYEEFAGLVRLHTSQILAYINALLLNWNDADDLFQETCLTLWQKFDEFQFGTNFLAWALRIADYKVMKFREKESRRAAFAVRLRDALMADVAEDGADDPAANIAALSGCMNRLAENDRSLVVLCYGESIPVRQIAHSLNRSPQSIHHSLCRVRKWLIGCIDRTLRQADTASSVPREIRKPQERP